MGFLKGILWVYKETDRRQYITEKTREMKTLLALASLLVVVNGGALRRAVAKTLPSDAPPCSTDASQAYLDVVLVIDTSANMGNSNLRRVSKSKKRKEKLIIMA